MAAAPLEAAALMKEYVMVPPETSKPSQPIGSAVPHSRSPRGGRAAQAGMGHQAKASNEHRGVGLGRGNVRGQAQSPRQRGGGHNVRGAPHIRGAAQARGRGVNGVRGRGVGAGRGGQVGRGGPRRPAPVRAGGRGGRGRGAGVVPRGKRPQANAQGRGLAMGEGVGRERAAVTAMMSEKKQTARGGQSTGMRERGQRNTVEKQTHSGNSCDAPAVSRGAEKSRHSDAPPTDAREEAAIQTPTQLPQERATGPPLDGRHTEHQLMRVQESQPPTGPLQASEIQRTTAREQCSEIGEREHSPFGTLASSELIGSSPRVAPLPQRVVSALPVPTEPAPLPPTFEKGQSAPQIVRKKKVPPHSGEGHIIAAAVPSRPPRRELSRNKSEEHLSGAVLSPCEQDGTLAQEEVVPSPVFTMLPPEDSLATPEGSSVRGEENTVGDSERADAGEESAGGQGDSDAVPFSFWESRVQPAFLYETMSFVHKHALGVEGVFRISASTARIAELKVAEKEGTLTAEFEKCKETDNGVLAVADFMNKHFQDSPLPLVPVHVFQEICQSVDVPEPETVREELRGLIYNMPEVSLSVFCALLNIAYDASLQCETTKMHAGNLAICIGPNIMYDPTPTLDVVAVRKEAGLMTSSLAEFIKDFPQIFEDVRSGTWREKGTPYAARLAVRLQAAAEVPGTPEPSPHQQVKKKKSKGVMPSFLKKKLKSATSYAPSKPDTEFMLRRRASCVHEPTTDDKEKHRMLQAMSVKLVDMDPSEICLLSFHQVRETLVEAEFPETSIDSHEKFLKTAILTLVTNLHSG